MLVYLLPGSGYFKLGLVFGLSQVEQVLKANISEGIKTDLIDARPYAEGPGIRIEVHGMRQMQELKQLIDIKVGR